ncbi:MAG TPA: hypothetical protein VI072_19625 [Polyangiaceae bacterium]
MKRRATGITVGAGYIALMMTALANACGSNDPKSNFNERDASASAGGNAGSGAGAGGFGGTAGSLIRQDGGGGTTLDRDAACGESQITAAPVQVNMLLVIDKSYSMTQTPAGFTSDKWSATKSALTATLNTLKDRIDFGLVMFPYQDPTRDVVTPIPAPGCGERCCEMPPSTRLNLAIEDGSTGVPKIVNTLNATTASGATPTAKALTTALTYFKTGAGAGLEGKKYVLLATDGGPNCNPALTCGADRCTDNIDGTCPLDGGSCCSGAARDACLDDVATIAKVQELRASGVPTIVVGIPGSEKYRSTLDALALSGGRPAQTASPSYYAVSTSGTAPGGLTDVLQSITRGLVTSCELKLTSAPPDQGRINVNIDGRNIPKAGPDGWDIVNTTTPPTIVLKGATCARITSSGAENVQILYGCPTEIVP